MAITFVGSNGTSRTDGAAITLSLPAANQNDLVIVFTGCQNETKGGPPSTAGYTALADLLHSTDACRLHASYKFMGATPDPSVSIPGAGSGIGLATLALVFRGVSTSTPLDVAVTTKNTNTGIPLAPPITPINNDCCVVIAAAAALVDTAVGGMAGYLPSPSVQQVADAVTPPGDVTVAALYQIFSGAPGTVNPLIWSSWTSGVYCAVTIALRPTTVSTDFNTVDKGNVTTTGKSIAELEKVAVNKASVSYLGKTIGIPDSSVESIFVDKYRMVITGQTVDVIETFRAVTVDKASVLYRGRAVTVREVQFEDIPRYSIKGRGSGHWMETR